MTVVFDLLQAIAEYWFRINNGISWGHILVPKKKVWTEGVNIEICGVDGAKSYQIQGHSRVSVACMNSPYNPPLPR